MVSDDSPLAYPEVEMDEGVVPMRAGCEGRLMSIGELQQVQEKDIGTVIVTLGLEVVKINSILLLFLGSAINTTPT